MMEKLSGYIGSVNLVAPASAAKAEKDNKGLSAFLAKLFKVFSSSNQPGRTKTMLQQQQAEGTITAPTGLKAAFEQRQAQGAATEPEAKADTGKVAPTKSVSFSDKVQKIIVAHYDDDTDSLRKQDSL